MAKETRSLRPSAASIRPSRGPGRPPKAETEEVASDSEGSLQVRRGPGRPIDRKKLLTSFVEASMEAGAVLDKLEDSFDRLIRVYEEDPAWVEQHVVPSALTHVRSILIRRNKAKFSAPKE